MIGILCIPVSWLGFAFLCFAMDRHQRDLLGRRLSITDSHRLRLAGFSMIALGLILSIAALGPAYGAVLWFGLLTLGAMPIVALVSVSFDRNHVRQQ
jgi:hypothetical protein